MLHLYMLLNNENDIVSFAERCATRRRTKAKETPASSLCLQPYNTDRPRYSFQYSRHTVHGGLLSDGGHNPRLIGGNSEFNVSSGCVSVHYPCFTQIPAKVA